MVVGAPEARSAYPGSMIVVGVDPGGRWTGIVTRSGRELVSHRTLQRPKSSLIEDLGPGLDAWRAENLEAITEALEAAVPHGQVALACEGIVAPNPHQRRSDGNSLTNVNGILATAVVFGAVLQEYAGKVVIVPPGGNGSAPRGCYPAEIDVPPGLRKGPPRDKNRHARSAWDVAGAAPYLLGMSRSLNRTRVR